MYPYVCFLYILLTLALKNCAESQSLKNAASDFNRCSIVKPILHHGRSKREISSTKDINGAHHSEVQVTIRIDDKLILLDLQLNKDLLARNHTLQYQEGGKVVQRKLTKEDLDLCHYSGSVRGKPKSLVAVSTCYGIRGVIYDGKTMRYIEPARDSEIKSPHYLYDHKDLNKTYNFNQHERATQSSELFNTYHKLKPIQTNGAVRYKRKTDNKFKGPYNANKESRYIELVLVADHREFQENDGNIHTVHSQMIQLVNIINSLYTPLNIYIALVGVVVWNEHDEINLDFDGDTTLANFLQYRKQKLVSDLSNDNAHLLTHQQFDMGLVGKALKSTMCTFEFSAGITKNYSSVIGLVATAIAHGIGHNFGMEHDTEDCNCPDDKCIMSSTISSVVPVHWSSCSLSSLKLAFEKGLDYCLRNKPKRLFESPNCGNGFIEPGEECDCGVTASGINTCHICCHPETCMLRTNATCGSGTCCDFTTCRLKPTAVICRPVDRFCDLPEFCTGHSEFCPSDVHRMDSTLCGKEDNQAYCVRGACRSHTDQCRLLWGATGESSHLKCYSNSNIKGDMQGNCGYDPKNHTYIACQSDDVLCGMLQCHHLNERLEFGLESVSILSAMFIANNGSIIPCRTAIIDLGLNDIAPGMVPDGAKCGDEKMCLKQRCVPITEVRELIKNMESSICPSDCSGHGVCNSEGHCHCDQGYAPPLCSEPGSGGSVDSGPATDLVRLSDLM